VEHVYTLCGSLEPCLPSYYKDAPGFLFSVEPLPDCAMTRNPVPPPSQACVFESLKRVLQASKSGLPAIDSSFKSKNAKAEGAGSAGAGVTGPPVKMLELMMEIRQCLDAGAKPTQDLVAKVNTLVWNKVVGIALQRSDIAHVVFGQGSGMMPGGKFMPISSLLPADHVKFLKTEEPAAEAQGSSGESNQSRLPAEPSHEEARKLYPVPQSSAGEAPASLSEQLSGEEYENQLFMEMLDFDIDGFALDAESAFEDENFF